MEDNNDLTTRVETAILPELAPALARLQDNLEATGSGVLDVRTLEATLRDRILTSYRTNETTDDAGDETVLLTFGVTPDTTPRPIVNLVVAVALLDLLNELVGQISEEKEIEAKRLFRWLGNRIGDVHAAIDIGHLKVLAKPEADELSISQREIHLLAEARRVLQLDPEHLRATADVRGPDAVGGDAFIHDIALAALSSTALHERLRELLQATSPEEIAQLIDDQAVTESSHAPCIKTMAMWLMQLLALPEDNRDALLLEASE